MRPAVAVILVWLVVAALAPQAVRWTAVRPVGPDLDVLPVRLDGYAGRPAALRKQQDMLDYGMRHLYDDALLRLYAGPEGPFEVQIFYCRTRRPRNRLTNTTNLVNCLHGHYHRVADATVALGPGVDARRLRLDRYGEQATAFFWLQSPGRTSADGFAHLLWQVRQDLLRARSDGCFVKIAYDGAPSVTRDAAALTLAREVHRAVDAWLAARTAADRTDAQPDPAGAGPPLRTRPKSNTVR